MSKIKCIIELSTKFISTGFFVARNVGILFLRIKNILIAEQESQTNKFLMRLISQNS